MTAQALHQPIGGAIATPHEFSSITPWVAVVLLFVLAQVFEHGARMRADLEGTV